MKFGDFDTDLALEEIADAQQRLKSLERQLEQEQSRETVIIALSLVLLGAGLLLTASFINDLGETALGEYLTSLVTEIGGAFLVFLLLDTLWRTRNERRQRLQDRYAASKRINARSERMLVLLEELNGIDTTSVVGMLKLSTCYATSMMLYEENRIDRSITDAEHTP